MQLDRPKWIDAKTKYLNQTLFFSSKSLKQSKPIIPIQLTVPNMRATALLFLAAGALSNLIPRQAPPSITPSPGVVSVTATVVAFTETLPDGPFASLDSVPGCSLAPSIRRLLDSAPRPGGQLRGELSGVSNFCGFAPTATVLSVEYSQYTSELVTWYEANSAALGSFRASFTSSCTVAQAAITSAVLACVSQITAEAAAASTGTGTGTGAAHATNATTTVSGVASTASSGAAAEQTRLAAAAGVVAGMMALMAVL
jgi:hypothetical protein